MIVYEFTALDKHGKLIKGTREAESPKQLRQNLRALGLSPIEVNAPHEDSESEKFLRDIFTTKFSANELSIITRQLATLSQAAVPIEEALKAVAEQQEKKKIKKIVMGIRSKVLEGYTLGQSLDFYSGYFSNIYRATVSAGEHAGYLGQVLEHLADYTEKRVASLQKIKLALTYPAILLLVSFAIITFLLAYIVPDIIGVFIENEQALPLPTLILIHISNSVQNYWYIASLLCFVLILGITHLVKKYTMQWNRLLLNLPIIGKLSKAFNTATFANTIALLIKSSIPLVEALHITAHVMSNEVIKKSILQASQNVKEGMSLNVSLKKTEHFPPLMLHMISSGEATGKLELMFEKIAKNQQGELENNISFMLTILEPLILLLMGTVILSIVLAVLLPIINMNTLL